MCSLAFFFNKPLAVNFFKFDLLFIPIARQSFENKAFRIKLKARKGSFVSLGKQAERIGNREFLKKEWQVGICEIKNELLIPPGGRGTLAISGWGCAARTLEPLAYTRASFS